MVKYFSPRTRAGIATGLVALTTLYTSGCASKLSGKYQYIPIQSNPQGADLVEEYTWKKRPPKVVGQTPIIHPVGRKHQAKLTLKKQGYLPYELKFRRAGLNKKTLINLITGPLCWIGFMVDGLSGASRIIKPYQVNVDLKRDPAQKIDPTLRAEVVEPRTQKQRAQPRPQDTMEKLLKLKKLLDAGAITQEEYDKKRKKYVGEL